jgi:hypothetical protein
VVPPDCALAGSAAKAPAASTKQKGEMIFATIRIESSDWFFLMKEA